MFVCDICVWVGMCGPCLCVCVCVVASFPGPAKLFTTFNCSTKKQGEIQNEKASSILGVYNSRPPLARYVWCSSCCSEPQFGPTYNSVLSTTFDVTHVKKKIPGPLHSLWNRKRHRPGNKAMCVVYACVYVCVRQSSCQKFV